MPDVQVPVIGTTRHSGYNGNNIANGRDIGLSQLASPILSVTPARVYRGSSERFHLMTAIGYGRFGTGLTGDNQGGANIRRAGQNYVEAYGTAIEVSNQMMLTDFDNPNNAGDNVLGSPVPVDFESGIAFYDSGSGWFMDIGGITYLTGITSFRASVDGTDNSDYGDLFGATRVSRELTWIDSAHDVTKFWNQTDGNWDNGSLWLPGSAPTSVNAAVIDGGVARVVTPGGVAKYTFVAGYESPGGPVFGTLRLENDFTSNNLIVRDGGRLEVGGAGLQSLTGELWVESEGTLALDLGSALTVFGDAELDGSLEVNSVPVVGPFSDPTVRGTANDFVLLTATSLTGTFDSIEVDGRVATPSVRTYTGTGTSGDDGIFRTVTYVGNTIEMDSYLAVLGDANGDGNVDGTDFLIWNDNKFTSGKDWTEGDFTGDGIVDGSDFLAWNDNKFTSTNGILQSVPEPVSSVLVGLAWLGFFGHRRRSRG